LAGKRQQIASVTAITIREINKGNRRMFNFQQMIGSIKHKHIYIQMHNFPDPDAIASAYGLQFLLEQKGIKSTICYKGRVDHGSSYSMVEKLGIDIVEYDELKDMCADSEIILVDAQKGNANIIDMPGEEVMCIDHHPTYEKVDYVFSDIRPEVGACASIIAQYFFNNNIEMSKNVATALLYGIKVDTANMTRGVSDLDLEMFYRIFNLADRQMITKLDHSTLRQEDLKAYANAINSIETVGRVSFANTGLDCPEALIAAISDFIMMLDNTDMTIVYSLRKDGIKISLRCNNGMDVGKIANKVLEGIGSGGGHENMAGGFVPYNHNIENAMSDDDYINSMIKDIENRFLAEIAR